jgi:hypothetical protein
MKTHPNPSQLMKRASNCAPMPASPSSPNICHQLKRALEKAGCKTFFKSGNKLKNLLCSRNKTRPDPLNTKGVYKIQCPCDLKAVYIGEMSRSFSTHLKEHRMAIESGQWNHSGLMQHKETFSFIITTVQCAVCILYYHASPIKASLLQ